ncbi:MAG: hypothetical protein JO257_19775 [Deltaproteobacteria bacterium]|nr:hypothetical protein [Deltaproteobacteria bacterium]
MHITGARGDLIAATVHIAVDAVSDPELAERLHTDDPSLALNVVRVDGSEAVRVPVPVIYHDPAAELMVLVLGEAQRHRELEERIAVLQQLASDDAPVPPYAKEFGVVYGGAGLRQYLEARAQQAVAVVGAQKDIERRKGEITAREHELREVHADLVKQKDALAKAQAQVAAERAELDRLRSEQRQKIIAGVATPAEPLHMPEPTTIGPPPEHVTTPVPRHDDDDDVQTSLGHTALPPKDFASEISTQFATITTPPAKTNGTNGVHVEIDDEITGTSIIPPGSDPLTTESIEMPVEVDPWLAMSATDPTSVFRVDQGTVRLALIAGDQIIRGLGGNVDVRVLLHRAPSYPVVTLVLGPPAAFRVPSPTQLAVLPLDIGSDLDRAVLTALAKRFEIQLDIILRAQPIRRVTVKAPLAENVAYILRAADDHLRGIQADGEQEPSYQRARDLVLGAGFDLLGVEHPEHQEFRDEKLAQLATAQHLRRAIAIARRFARPSREDYLICTRGFPLTRWRELRRHVCESAVAWGIWMGPELAQVAVSEGLARSRRDLIVKLEAGFETLRTNQSAFDIDADAADDNAKAIAEEAKALGVELRRKGTNGGAIKSEDVPMVSGSIERTPTGALPHAQSTDELIAQLDDKKNRVTAAAELCDRGDAKAAAPVIAAVKKMSRAEAVRILGKSVKFGAVAAGPLIEGLQSSKAYLRHGCALALALLRTDEGTHAVIDLLVSEPTEIWREIARAIGQVGPAALMPLAAHVGRMGDRVPPATAERIAWAMAHVAVRGGHTALDQMASGQSVVAPIAKQALQFHATAARDEVRVRPGGEAKDVTVNRAFSRRFFEALEADRPEDAAAALHEIDADGEILDDADLIVDEDEEVDLDESDLIQT